MYRSGSGSCWLFYSVEVMQPFMTGKCQPVGFFAPGTVSYLGGGRNNYRNRKGMARSHHDGHRNTRGGGALGYWMWRSQPPLKNSGNPGRIIRAGTPLTMGMIVITFCIKFILTSAIFIRPGLAASASFCMLMGGLTGLLDGVFWGGTLRIFLPWYNKRLI